MAVQRHSPAVPEAEPDPLLSGATRATDRAYPEPACMWLQGYIPNSFPSQSKRVLCHRRTGEYFYEHEHQRKCSGARRTNTNTNLQGRSFFATMFTQE